MAINLVSMNEEASGYREDEYLASNANSRSDPTSKIFTHDPQTQDKFREDLQGRPNLEL